MLQPVVCVREVDTKRRSDLTRLKAEMSRPAKNGALDAEDTSKLRTSFHAYGSRLVKAIGSATRTSAAMRGQCKWRFQCSAGLHTKQEQLSGGKGVFIDIPRTVSSFGKKRHAFQPELDLTASPPRSVHKLRDSILRQ